VADSEVGVAKILVVDDQDMIVSLVQRTLELNGHDVTAAADGRTALRLMSENPPDLVITDIFMPEMDGLEFLRETRAVSPRPRVIAMSGGGVMDHGQVLHLARALGAGMVLQKPFLPTDLMERVDHALALDPEGAPSD